MKVGRFSVVDTGEETGWDPGSGTNCWVPLSQDLFLCVPSFSLGNGEDPISSNRTWHMVSDWEDTWDAGRRFKVLPPPASWV